MDTQLSSEKNIIKRAYVMPYKMQQAFLHLYLTNLKVYALSFKINVISI